MLHCVSADAFMPVNRHDTAFDSFRAGVAVACAHVRGGKRAPTSVRMDMPGRENKCLGRGLG